MKLETQCPNCSKNLIQNSADLNLDREVTCAVCNHRADLAEFITPASRKRLQEAVNEAVAKAFANIPGFKK